MLSHVAGTELPVRTLAQASRNGSGQFEVAAIDGLTQQQKDLFFIPHRKDFYLLALIRSGSSRHWLDGVSYTLEPGTLYFSSPQQVFLKEEGSFAALSFCFTQEFLDLEEGTLFRQLPILQNLQNGHALPLSPADQALIEDLGAKMLAEAQQDQSLSTRMQLAYLRVLLIHLSRLYRAHFTAAVAAQDRALFDRFRGLLNTHFSRHHDVAAYAGMLHLSAGHLGEQIKMQSGRTPMEHIHDRLLLEAKRLLFHTDASVKEIAFRLGFEEASYFIRFFRRLTATTPAAYRAAIREMYH